MPEKRTLRKLLTALSMRKALPILTVRKLLPVIVMFASLAAGLLSPKLFNSGTDVPVRLSPDMPQIKDFGEWQRCYNDFNVALSGRMYSDFTDSSTGGLDALNDGALPRSSRNVYRDGIPASYTWRAKGGDEGAVELYCEWDSYTYVTGTQIYFACEDGTSLPRSCSAEYQDAAGKWHNAGYIFPKRDRFCGVLISGTWCMRIKLTIKPEDGSDVGIIEWRVSGHSSDISAEYPMREHIIGNNYMEIATGDSGEPVSLRLFDGGSTEFIYQDNLQKMPFGAMSLSVKLGKAHYWTSQNTADCTDGVSMEIIENDAREHSDTCVLSYENDSSLSGINLLAAQEQFRIEGNTLAWEITVSNRSSSQKLTIGDLCISLPFGGSLAGSSDEVYQKASVVHPFVGGDSSYICVQSPSGKGAFLLLYPDSSTGARFEYADLESAKYYIHSAAVDSVNGSSLSLLPGQSKTYRFFISALDSKAAMSSQLYNAGLAEAVAVPGMIYSRDMPAMLYLHTKAAANTIFFGMGADTQSNIEYIRSVNSGGEQYHVYRLSLVGTGEHNISVTYGSGKHTRLSFYITESAGTLLEQHSDFSQKKQNRSVKAFEDWDFEKGDVFSALTDSYWTNCDTPWGGDASMSHGMFLAEKNVYLPVASQVEAVDDYLAVCVWNGLMAGHHSDYLVRSALQYDTSVLASAENSKYSVSNSAVYLHAANSYYSMYKIASRYPSLVNYRESAEGYLLKSYRIIKGMYGCGAGDCWNKGILGEQLLPKLSESLRDESFGEYAAEIDDFMTAKYNNIKISTYPFGSDGYNSTGEESIFTLASGQFGKTNDITNARRIMSEIDEKIRACRGTQPIWHLYAFPIGTDGQASSGDMYTASVAGMCLDEHLRSYAAGKGAQEKALAQRMSYASKLCPLAFINSGKISADARSIGAVSGGYSASEGWLQTSGCGDIGLWGAMKTLSSDVVTDPIFGLFGYGCLVSEENDYYTVKPLDGLRTRLNLINNGLSIEFLRDRYKSAVIKTDKSSLTFTIDNVTQSSHTSKIRLTGLGIGTYTLTVGGKQQGSYTVFSSNAATTVIVTLPQGSGCTVELKR